MNLKVVCGSVEEVRVNPTGFRTTIEISLNDVEVESLLEQVSVNMRNSMPGLDDLLDDEAAKDFELLQIARQSAPDGGGC